MVVLSLKKEKSNSNLVVLITTIITTPITNLTKKAANSLSKHYLIAIFLLHIMILKKDLLNRPEERKDIQVAWLVLIHNRHFREEARNLISKSKNMLPMDIIWLQMNYYQVMSMKNKKKRLLLSTLINPKIMKIWIALRMRIIMKIIIIIEMVIIITIINTIIINIIISIEEEEIVVIMVLKALLLLILIKETYHRIRALIIIHSIIFLDINRMVLIISIMKKMVAIILIIMVTWVRIINIVRVLIRFVICKISLLICLMMSIMILIPLILISKKRRVLR